MTSFIPDSVLKAFVAVAVIVKGTSPVAGIDWRLRKLDIQIDRHTMVVNYHSRSHKFGEMQITWKH